MDPLGQHWYELMFEEWVHEAQGKRIPKFLRGYHGTQVSRRFSKGPTLGKSR